jgi:hypothetical protein
MFFTPQARSPLNREDVFVLFLATGCNAFLIPMVTSQSISISLLFGFLRAYRFNVFAKRDSVGPIP